MSLRLRPVRMLCDNKDKSWTMRTLNRHDCWTLQVSHWNTTGGSTRHGDDVKSVTSECAECKCSRRPPSSHPSSGRSPVLKVTDYCSTVSFYLRWWSSVLYFAISAVELGSSVYKLGVYYTGLYFSGKGRLSRPTGLKIENRKKFGLVGVCNM